MMRAKLIVVLFFFLASFSSINAGSNSVVGLWTTPENKSRVEISKCGDKLCGRIVWLKEPNYPADDDKGMAGKRKIDRENPDKKFRNRPTLGLLVLQGFVHAGGNLWTGGTVYDPENGKTYKCKLTLTSPARLEVRGYIGFSWIGRTSVWMRKPM